MDQALLAVIAARVCYTELVFARVNKKLATTLTTAEVKAMVQQILNDSSSQLVKRGKNYYVSNKQAAVQLTINSFNYRLITASKYLS